MNVNGLDASYYYAKDFDRAVSFYSAIDWNATANSARAI
jgi:hypothetical protein